MKKMIEFPRVIVRFIAHHWIGVAVVALLAIFWAVGSPAWASTGPGDLYVTVPAPLPTEPVTLPTPTSTPKNDDDGEEEQPNQPPSAEQPTPPPGEEDKLFGMVIPLALNVRSGPGTSFAVIGKLAISDTVEILYRDQGGSWWQICCTKPDERQGWVSAPLIRPDFDPARANELLSVAPDLTATTIPAPTPQAPAQPAAETQANASAPAGTGLTASVNADRLNLRSGSGTDFAIVAKLLRGESVEVLARNGSGDWWYVCCTAGTTTAGWTSAPYLAPAFDRASANQLLPIFTVAQTPVTPTAPITTTAGLTATGAASETGAAGAVVTSTVTTADAASASASTSLIVQMQLAPAFALQGQPLQIVVVVTNTGSVTASNVALRDELAQSLALVDGDAGTAGLFRQETTENGGTVASFTWPQVAPGEQVTAILTVNLAADLPDGSVVDNLAAVQADNAGAATTGVSIGMPPTTPPDFR
jgi:uncharacterized repeat protein (TIGR01451 family)